MLRLFGMILIFLLKILFIQILIFLILLVIYDNFIDDNITEELMEIIYVISYWIAIIVYVLAKIVLNKKNVKRHKRGSLFISEKDFKQIVKKNSRIRFSEYISIPQNFETRHFFISGTTGTGKTALISQVIEQLKYMDQKVILYDAKDGEFVARFYNPQTDLIFNPFDARSIYWNVFEAIKNDSDFDALAKSVIPETYGSDRFFIDAARDVLSGIFRYCYINGKTDNACVWEIIQQPNDVLYEKLASIQHESCSYIENSGGGQTQGVISTLKQFV